MKRSGLRKTLKYLLPHGVFEIAQNIRRLRAIGKKLRPTDWWRSDWLMHQAESSGLMLFPAGHVPDLQCVVDVGANAGQWCSMLLDCITPKRLILIEPEPKAFAQLKRNFGHLSAVELHNLAIGEKNGTTKFRITADTTGASVLLPRKEMQDLIGRNWRVESEIEVPISTLDQLLANVPEISLLKIDVQGYEKSVIAGAHETLARTKSLLIELNFMHQYVNGSWLGELHEILTREHSFFLANVSKPLCLNGRASMCDGLYINPKLVRRWVEPDFV
jgi:FkbM family methyltransferase